MEDFCGELDERGKDLDVKIRETIESFNNLEFYPSRAELKKKKKKKNIARYNRTI